MLNLSMRRKNEKVTLFVTLCDIEIGVNYPLTLVID